MKLLKKDHYLFNCLRNQNKMTDDNEIDPELAIYNLDQYDDDEDDKQRNIKVLI